MSSISSQRSGGSWLRTFRPVPSPRLRLVCLPHAGGTAGAFHGWPALLPADVELVAVQYPGRQERLGEQCVDNMDRMADHVTQALLPLTDRPLALFGHSMGAAVAYEVALRLEIRHRFTLRGLFVSAQHPPTGGRSTKDLHLRDDEALLDGVRELGGMEEAVLTDPDLRCLILPSLRADVRLIETYGREEPQRVNSPLRAYAGRGDPRVREEHVEGWKAFTSADFTVRVFPGGHFYLSDQQAELVADLSEPLIKGARDVP